MRRLPTYLALLALAAGQGIAAQQRIANVEQALALGSQLSGRSGPPGLTWIDGGTRFSYLARNATSGSIEVRGFDPASANDALLFDAGDLRVPGTGAPLQYRAFDWAVDSRHVIFETDFRPIYRNSGDRRLLCARRGRRLAGPGGRRRAHRRALPRRHAPRLRTQRRPVRVRHGRRSGATALTSTGTEDVWNGVFDWVYEEEFGLTQAWSWSPDSRRIAYWQTRVAETPTIQITDWEGQYPEWTVMPFPKVGQPNSIVEIGVVDVASAETRWMELDLEGEYYVPRIYWTNDPSQLAVVTLNRRQNELALYFFDVTTGDSRLVMQERSDAWIDVFDFFAGVLHYFHFPRQAWTSSSGSATATATTTSIGIPTTVSC